MKTYQELPLMRNFIAGSLGLCCSIHSLQYVRRSSLSLSVSLSLSISAASNYEKICSPTAWYNYRFPDGIL